jgi:hypothetical protein
MTSKRLGDVARNKRVERRARKQQDREIIDSPAPFTFPAILRQTRIDPKSLSPHDVLHLQRTIGNRAVTRLIQPQLTTQTAIQRKAPVRLPDFDEEFIKTNEVMAKQMIIQSIKDLREGTLIEWVKEPFSTETAIHWVKNLTNAAPINLKLMATAVRKAHGPDSDFGNRAMEPRTLQQPSEDKQMVLKQLNKILWKLDPIQDNYNLLKAIFGLTDLQATELAKVNKVFKDIYRKLYAIYKEQQDLVTLNQDPQHFEAAGVGALTNKDSATAGISNSAYTDLLKGTPEGLSTIIHEFSHSVADTLDIGYSQAELEALTPEQRINNAETYAQAFLYSLDFDPKRLYDPKKVVETGSEAIGQSSGKALRIRFKAVRTNMVGMWNAMDNVYNVFKDMYRVSNGTFKSNDHKQQAQFDLALNLIKAGIYPHQPNLYKYPNEVLAYIEYRTALLHRTRHGSKGIIAALKAAGVEKADVEKPIIENETKDNFQELTGLVIKGLFAVDVEAARKIVIGLQIIDKQEGLEKLASVFVG